MERDILHIGVDAFFISVERVVDPSLRGRPLVVVGGSPVERVVIFVSGEARRCGIRPGMPLEHAQRLCREAAVVSPNSSLYEKASCAVMRILNDYSPAVEKVSLDEAYLDLTGTRRLWGPPRDVARKIAVELRRRFGLSATIGVASNRFVAKVATVIARPSAIMDVAHGWEADILAPLPVRCLPAVGPVIRKRLERMGVGTIGKLAEIPRQHLEVAFGRAAGLLLYRRARGIDETPVRPGPQKASIWSEVAFGTGVRDREILHAALFGCLEDLCTRLRRWGRCASQIVVGVEFVDLVTVSRHAFLPVESDIETEIFPVAARLFTSAVTRRVLIRRLAVRLTCRGIPWRQIPLFGAGANQRRRRLFDSIDAIRRRYGWKALHWGRMAAIVPGRTAG